MNAASTSIAPNLYYEPPLPHVFAPPDLPTFSHFDAQRVTDCAKEARQKIDLRSAATDQTLLSRLPLYQPKNEHPNRKGAIYCRSGGWLEVLDDRTAFLKRRRNQTAIPEYIRGTRRETSRFAILELISVAFGLVSIRGLESQNFICMDGRGSLYAAPSELYSAECVFMEQMLHNYYNLYSSCAHGDADNPWFLSIRRLGRAQTGRSTSRHHRSSHFIVIHFDENGLLDPVPQYLSQAAYRIQNHWIQRYSHSWRRPTPPILQRQEKPWAPAALLTSESRSLSELLDASLRSRSSQRSSNWTRQRHSSKQMSAPMTSAERRVFRRERHRNSRIIREQQRRKHRRMELERLRSSSSFANNNVLNNYGS